MEFFVYGVSLLLRMRMQYQYQWKFHSYLKKKTYAYDLILMSIKFKFLKEMQRKNLDVLIEDKFDFMNHFFLFEICL